MNKKIQIKHETVIKVLNVLILVVIVGASAAIFGIACGWGVWLMSGVDFTILAVVLTVYYLIDKYVEVVYG